jgi:glyoxylase-like metal-dependent hydrolase (beta-lactamase superfamily II)
MRVLFDSGLSGGKPQPALARNAAMLGAGLGDLDAVVISHLHADHVGGLRAMRRRTFAFAADPLEPRGVPAARRSALHAGHRDSNRRALLPGTRRFHPVWPAYRPGLVARLKTHLRLGAWAAARRRSLR